VDSQVADSACSATAYLGGVKANIGTAGVTGKVKVNDCAAMKNTSNQVPSILKWSQVRITVYLLSVQRTVQLS
jgi:alkaline phosphatase